VVGAPPPELVGRDPLLEQARLLLGRILQRRAEKSLLFTGLGEFEFPAHRAGHARYTARLRSRAILRPTLISGKYSAGNR
jgi:hypothetical protein